jgi:hypothetical protein
MTERPPPVDPEDNEPDNENPAFDRFEEAMKKLLDAEPRQARTAFLIASEAGEPANDTEPDRGLDRPADDEPDN